MGLSLWCIGSSRSLRSPLNQAIANVPNSSQVLQNQRLISRNSLSPTEAANRISSQAPLASKLPYADFVIDNSGPLSDLIPQVNRVVSKLNERAGWSWVLSWLIPPWGVLRGLARIGWRLYVKRIGEGKGKGGTRGERERGREKEMELKDLRGR